MYIDLQRFPLVDLVYEPGVPPDAAAFLAQFEQALDQEHPFVLISPDAPELSADPDQALRKQLVLWIKQHKERLQALVRGHIMIEADPDKRAALEAMAPLTQKVWGYPLHVTDSARSADTLASRWLQAAPGQAG